MRIGLLFQPYLPASQDLALKCKQHLDARGIDSLLVSGFQLTSEDAQGLTVVLAFGGDGTVLRAARWLAPARVPIVPVHMGSVSFLSELVPEDLPMALDAYVDGDFWVDERLMLRGRCGEMDHVALNDIVLGRGAALRAVKLDLTVDDAHLGQYTADGLIIATPTGSTAYSLAAGGPILYPELDAIIVQPVAAHLASLPPLVLPKDVVIRTMAHSPHPTTLSFDGQVDVELRDGEEVTVTVAQEQTLFARRRPRSAFYARLVSQSRR